MNVLGIICEYNPFHNGHAYHIRKAREASGCDVAFGVMSGSFVQRGEPAIADKWIRAHAALLGGLDLIVELPALFAVRAARDFARAGMFLVGSLGATHFSFGCEEPAPCRLSMLADLLASETPALQSGIKRHLASGCSYPRSIAAAVADCHPELASVLTQPNNVLAVEYLRACHELSLDITPVPVMRTGGHHAPGLGEFASASAIRKALMKDEPDDITGSVPPYAMGMLTEYAARHSSYELLALDALRTRADEIEGLPDHERGLTDRLRNSAYEAATFAEALALAKCKRYPLARLRRLAAQLVLGVTPALVAFAPQPEYARVLAMRQDARPLLRMLRDSSRVPVVMRSGELKNFSSARIDIRATDVFALDHPNARPGQDFSRSPVILGNKKYDAPE